MMHNAPENIDMKNKRSYQIDQLRKRDFETIIETDSIKATPKSFVNSDKFNL